MKKSYLLLSILALTACVSEDGPVGAGSGSTPGSGQAELHDLDFEKPYEQTHQVCVRSNDVYYQNHPIDTGKHSLMVDSLSGAGNDASKKLDIEKDWPSALAPMSFVTSSFAHPIGDFALYGCTYTKRRINGCNSSFGDEEIRTVIDGNQNYTAVVTKSGTQIVEINGKVGDIGNLTITHSGYVGAYGPVASYTFTSTRTAGGLETGIFESEQINWTAQERGDCSGSLTFSNKADPQYGKVSADYQWTGKPPQSTGSVNYTNENGTVSTTW